MTLTAQELYSTICDQKVKKAIEFIQDGFYGMYFVLKILFSAQRELTAGDIAESFGVTTARTAVMLKTLETKGYITKSKSKDDARKTIVRLTNSGAVALRERKERLFAVIDGLMMKLDDAEKEQLFHILRKLAT